MPRLSRWRSVGSAGEPYPRWLRDLEHESGAYAIRDADTREVLYVGESHSDRLKATITRHLQRWTEDSGWWTEREGVEVAVLLTDPGDAEDAQEELIARLNPTVNRYLLPDDDEEDEEDEDAVPF
jgi:hypothetical protein